MSNQSGFISQSELGRLLNLPHTKIISLIKKGTLVPDQIVSNKYKLFARAKIEQLRNAALKQTL